MSVASDGRSADSRWEGISTRMRIVRLSLPVGLGAPLLVLLALPRSTRGFTFPPGRAGIAIGGALLGTSVIVGLLLVGVAGAAGGGVSGWALGIGGVALVWLLGTAGAAWLASGIRPTAYVKPICVDCRLLPVIKEHEAIHLSGVQSEKEVWTSMKTRHSVQSLALEGDPAICSFCPIAKRLSER